MAKIDLTSPEWCDLIFEGKNKAYGAYKIRMSSPKRHTWSVIIVLVFSILAFSIPKLIELAIPKKADTGITTVTKISTLDEADIKDKKLKKFNPVAPPPPPLKTTIKFVAPVIAKDNEVRDEDEMKSQEQLTKSDAAISIADVKGNDDKNGKDIADIKQIVTQQAPVEKKVEDDKPYTAVEQMPQFPGGDAELLKYISNNLKYPAISQENGVQGKVMIRFVVSKTGNVTDAKVVRSLDPYCDKEALRVVKSLPTWIPGKQNGVNVPVYYVVPITFRLQ
jgi:periplasmic protein TonB